MNDIVFTCERNVKTCSQLGAGLVDSKLVQAKWNGGATHLKRKPHAPKKPEV